MPLVAVDPELALVDRDDVLRRRSDLNVVEPDPNEVPNTLETDEPVSLITGIKTWRDSWLEHLSPGDWVTTVGAGYDTYPTDEFADRGIGFTHCPGVSAQQVAEHAFAMGFSFTRDLWTLRDRQRQRQWESAPAGLTDLAGDSCCIVGLGSIGEAVAERARAFEMTVRGVKRTVEGYSGAAHEVYRAGSLQEALEGVRFVLLAVPLTEETRGLIGPEELALLAEGAILVNVARGAVVQTEALPDALNDGPLRAVGLDVTHPEPLPADSPLWPRDDVLITPHCASRSTKYAERFVDRYLAEFDRWVEGKPFADEPI